MTSGTSVVLLLLDGSGTFLSSVFTDNLRTDDHILQDHPEGHILQDYPEHEKSYFRTFILFKELQCFAFLKEQFIVLFFNAYIK